MFNKKNKFDKKRPILVFAYNFMPQKGGIQTYSYELCRNLHKNGYNIIALARSYKDCKEFDEEQPFKIIRVKGASIKIIGLLPIAIAFIFAVLRYKVKLVHCVNWIPCGFISAVFRRLLFCKFVLSCHGSEITMALKKITHKKLLIFTLKRASWIIAGNNYLRTIINNLNLSPPVSVIHYGVDYEFFIPNLEANFLKIKYGLRGNNVLLTVAELKSRKNIDTVLYAVKDLVNNGIKIIYLIVGNGPDQKRLQQISNQLGLDDNVFFIGDISEKDLKFHYSVCDIFIMPSRKEKNGDIEGFGITFIEAAATGKPAIGSKCGGIPDSVSDNKTGLLADPNSKEDIAKKIQELINDKEKAKKMGKEARERVISLFTWQNVINKTEMLYKKIFS